jgi:biuret amidohydrolase
LDAARGHGGVHAAATAGARVPDGDGYQAGTTNFRFMANTVWSTDEAIARMAGRN